MDFNLLKQADFAIERLENAGFEAYAVGGCVRDVLLLKKPQDIDITTSAIPEEIKSVFSGEKTIETGIKYGTVTVIIDGVPLEITTFRRDGGYMNHRRPESVRFSKRLSDDVTRRDFTMNSICYNKKCGIVDLCGGIADLEKRIIRAIGNPDERFKEDALRILRAFRFMAQLDFAVDSQTLLAAQKNAELLSEISRERITSELFKLINAPNSVKTLRLMKGTGVLTDIVAEITEREEKILRLCEGKTGEEWFKIKLFTAVKGFDKLSLSNKQKADMVLFSLPPPQSRLELKRLVGKLSSAKKVQMLIDFYSLCGLDMTIRQTELNQIIENDECLSLSRLKLNGRDLAHLLNGAEYGEVLGFLLEEVMAGRLKNEKPELYNAAVKYKNSKLRKV